MRSVNSVTRWWRRAPTSLQHTTPDRLMRGPEHTRVHTYTHTHKSLCCVRPAVPPTLCIIIILQMSLLLVSLYKFANIYYDWTSAFVCLLCLPPHTVLRDSWNVWADTKIYMKCIDLDCQSVHYWQIMFKYPTDSVKAVGLYVEQWQVKSSIVFKVQGKGWKALNLRNTLT